MKLRPGIFLKSTAVLDATFFADATIFVTEYNADGAIGFVINRPFGRSLNELEAFRHSTTFPLYEGGPVDREHLFFLHQRPDLILDGVHVGNSVYLGGDFQQAVAGINKEQLSHNDIKIFVGYCGWDAGELETEIGEGSWTVTEGMGKTVFG